ncbi:MAG: K(+)-transporting ATPase subunit C [Defluviitaleaceae bacterium]|nr:K(+)-transporting ATPase subunit C [Defluviitaleaceae bacterium]
MKTLLKQFRPAVMCFLALTALCGVVYTGAMTGLGQLFFPRQANGSVITVTLKDGAKKDYGSALIAQEFTEPQYLVGRPQPGTGVSANGRPLMPANLSPVSQEYKDEVQAQADWWRDFQRSGTEAIPADLVAGSGSGVDPYISPAAAEFQVPRIADARGITADAVRAVIKKYTVGRFLGFIGEPGVNVLKVNLALDGLI